MTRTFRGVWRDRLLILCVSERIYILSLFGGKLRNDYYLRSKLKEKNCKVFCFATKSAEIYYYYYWPFTFAKMLWKYFNIYAFSSLFHQKDPMKCLRIWNSKSIWTSKTLHLAINLQVYLQYKCFSSGQLCGQWELYRHRSLMVCGHSVSLRLFIINVNYSASYWCKPSVNSVELRCSLKLNLTFC